MSKRKRKSRQGLSQVDAGTRLITRPVKNLSNSTHIEYYPFLDGFRALAIFMILFHHMRRSLDLDHLLQRSLILEWVYRKAWRIFDVDLSSFYVWLQGSIWKMKGVLGVQMFFVISGFLITRILLRQFDGKISVGRFYQRRFFKIYPIYFFLIIVSLAIFFWQNPAPLTEILTTAGRYLFLLQNYYLRNPFLEHTWSLVVTEQFYLVCPLVILLVYTWVPTAKLRRIVLIGICLALLLTAPMIRIYYLNTGHPPLEWPYRSPFPFLTTLYHIGPVAFGCLLALLEPYLKRWKKNFWCGLAFWITGVSLYVYLTFGFYWDYFVGAWYLYTLGYLASGCLIIAAYHGVSLLVHLKSVQWVGRHSYGIYLWHYLPLCFWSYFLDKVWSRPLVIMVLFMLSSLILGVISTKTIERYFLSLREKVAPK